MSTKRDEMMTKIVKVLNLSSKATGEEKRTSWMMARKLMAKYRIEFEDVVSKMDDYSKVEGVVEVTIDNLWYNIRNTFLAKLALVVASNFRCKLLLASNELNPKVTRPIFVGFEDDAKLASTIFKLIYETCRYEANDLYKKYRYGDESVLVTREDRLVHEGLFYGVVRPVDFKSTYYNDFAVGLSSGFNKQTISDTTTELMVIVPQQVHDYVNSLDLDTEKNHSGTAYAQLGGVNESAYSKGYETSTLSSRLLEED